MNYNNVKKKTKQLQLKCDIQTYNDYLNVCECFKKTKSKNKTKKKYI